MDHVVLGELAYWQTTILKVVGVLAAVLLPAGAFVQTYLFKMVSHLQSRLGPMEAGPHGSLQLLAEVGKSLQKEDIVPTNADRAVFKLAPYIVVATVLLMYLVVPFGPDMYFANLDAGVFYILAVSSVSVIGVLIAGWASANKYSLMGAIRAAGQLIAYELPMVLAVVGVVIQAGTMNLQGIVYAQATGEIFGWDTLGNPYVLTQGIGLFIFFVAMQAELTQTPFDMPVAESELVTGYMTEYSGIRFLLFFIAEFAAVGAFGALASVLWLGGWYIPFVDMDANYMNIVGPIVMFSKMMAIAFVVFWVRFTYPRLREDQLQMFAWKYLIPLSLINIVATGTLKVVF
ncbi:MAG: complex I subunit 1 family protein [Acidimicrobiia bacterium]